jgi:hypothetical protein
MTRDRIYISVVLEPDQDWPVADIVYDGVQWASATLHDGELKVTVYADTQSAGQIPIDDAIASLEQAKHQIHKILDEAPPDRP